MGRHSAPKVKRQIIRPIAALSRRATVITALATGAALLVADPSGAAFNRSITGRVSPSALAPTCVTEITPGTTWTTQATFLNGWGVWAKGPFLCSPSRRYVIGLQTDGNFVEYDMSLTPGMPKWNSWTYVGHTGLASRMTFEPDGNLVLYDASNSPLRATWTQGIPLPAKLTVNDSGNMMLKDANGVIRYQSAGTERLNCSTSTSFTCDAYTGVEGSRPVGQ